MRTLTSLPNNIELILSRLLPLIIVLLLVKLIWEEPERTWWWWRIWPIGVPIDGPDGGGPIGGW